MRGPPLRQAEAAVLAAGRARGAGGAGREAAWNHGEFVVAYPSLRPHLCLGGVYVRLLLEGLDQARRWALCAVSNEGVKLQTNVSGVHVCRPLPVPL